MDADTATVEIAITQPWWIVTWDGTRATVQTAPGLDGEHPDDWGIPCTNRDYTDAWRDEGGTPYVVEQILDGCAGTGAKAHIVAVRGSAEARKQLVAKLRAFTDAHPQCAPELRRFAREAA